MFILSSASTLPIPGTWAQLFMTTTDIWRSRLSRVLAEENQPKRVLVPYITTTIMFPPS